MMCLLEERPPHNLISVSQFADVALDASAYAARTLCTEKLRMVSHATSCRGDFRFAQIIIHKINHKNISQDISLH
jgi:hypothetical protein